MAVRDKQVHRAAPAPWSVGWVLAHAPRVAGRLALASGLATVLALVPSAGPAPSVDPRHADLLAAERSTADAASRGGVRPVGPDAGALVDPPTTVDGVPAPVETLPADAADPDGAASDEGGAGDAGPDGAGDRSTDSSEGGSSDRGSSDRGSSDRGSSDSSSGSGSSDKGSSDSGSSDAGSSGSSDEDSSGGGGGSTSGPRSDSGSGSSSGGSSGGVGLPKGTTLRVHHGDLTITKAGTVVDGLDVRGFVRVKAKDVVIKNSIIRGPDRALTSSMSLIQAVTGADANLVVQDTTIYAQRPSRFVDGIVGMGFTLRRVDIHTVVDQVKIIGSNVRVADSWLHGNLYYPASGSHKESHDDNVQVAVGSNIQVVRSRLEGTTNAAVMITQDRGSVRNFRFEGNRANHGACTINVAEKSYGPPPGLTIVDNVFGTGQRHSRCAVLLKDSTRAGATVRGNVFTDGSAVKVSKG